LTDHLFKQGTNAAAAASPDYNEPYPFAVLGCLGNQSVLSIHLLVFALSSPLAPSYSSS
jgi:hypothetical protein